MVASHVKVPPDQTRTRKPAAKKTTPAKKKPAVKASRPKPQNSWDQQPDETDAAYTAFLVYRALGRTRTILGIRDKWGAVGGELGVSGKPPSATSIERWASVNSWRLRAQAWDAELEAEWTREVQDRRLRAARRNADIAEAGMGLVEAQLKKMIARTDPDSDQFHPDAVLDVLDIRRLVDSMSRLQRLALGESTENVQVTGKDGGPVAIEDLTKLTDEQRMTRMEELQQEMEKRLDEMRGSSDDA